MKSFSAAPASYSTDAPIDTPFHRARAELDGLLGSATVRAANWRYAFFGMLVIALLLALSVAHLCSARQVIPVIVGIDREMGRPVVLGDAEKQIHEPGELEIKYFLSQVVREVRAIPADPVVLKQNWLHAYAFFRKGAASLLNSMTSDDADSPLKKVGDITLIPQPLSVVRVPGSDAYQMHWRETVFNKEGMKVDEYTMLGTFSLEVESPRDMKSLTENPLGIYITNFQWNRELKQ